jgi:hypothetical protein
LKNPAFLMHAPQPLHDPEMMRWAEPIIHDVVSASYADLVDDRREVQFLTRCQTMLWRALLTGTGSVSLFQDEVWRNALRLGLGEHRIAETNRQIVTELMLVIATRHARSPRQAAQASVQVAQAYGRLTEAKAQHQT